MIKVYGVNLGKIIKVLISIDEINRAVELSKQLRTINTLHHEYIFINKYLENNNNFLLKIDKKEASLVIESYGEEILFGEIDIYSLKDNMIVVTEDILKALCGKVHCSPDIVRATWNSFDKEDIETIKELVVAYGL